MVAYLTAHEQAGPSAAELRAFLGQRLPEHMLPSAFVVLDQLPLTPNGKVDRRALPAPDYATAQTEYTPPATPAEEVLAGVWADVLGVERVGVHDNFFELGGDSILSIQVVVRAQQAGLHLSPRLLFQHQTVAELARAVGMARPVVAEQGLIQGDAPLTPIQHWFLDQDLPQSHHFNQALLLTPHRPLRADVLGRALTLLQQHHDALRLRFRCDGDAWSAHHAEDPAAVPVPTVDLSGAARSDQQGGAALERAAAAQAQAGLDLARGPLLRRRSCSTSAPRAGPGRLLLVLHHLVVDGVSWRVLLEDLLAAYRQLEAGRPVALPPKTTSWQHWSRRLAVYARADGLRQELPFWLDPDRQQVEPLPQDLCDGDDTAADAQTLSVELSRELTAALLQEVPAVYRTQINDVLLTALLQAYARWSGRRRLLVDLEGHGREELFDDVDLSRTVGWFTTLYPVLLEVPASAGPGQALQAVKGQLRRVPQRGLGYGLLCYLTGDELVAEQLRAMHRRRR